MGKRRTVLNFEGDPLVVVKLTEREEAGPLRELLLSNGRSARIVAQKEFGYPGLYRLMLHGAKGARGILLSRTSSLELSGLEDGSTAVISVDSETDELQLNHRR